MANLTSMKRAKKNTLTPEQCAEVNAIVSERNRLREEFEQCGKEKQELKDNLKTVKEKTKVRIDEIDNLAADLRKSFMEMTDKKISQKLGYPEWVIHRHIEGRW